MNDHQKKMEELVKSQTMLEEEAATVKDIIHRAGLKISMHSRPKGGGTSSFSSSMQSWNGGGGEGSGDGGSTNLMHDLGIIIDRLHHMENEKKVRQFFLCIALKKKKIKFLFVFCLQFVGHPRTVNGTIQAFP